MLIWLNKKQRKTLKYSGYVYVTKKGKRLQVIDRQKIVIREKGKK